jgi:tetratricopeptide (TPR) repeat protein
VRLGEPKEAGDAFAHALAHTPGDDALKVRERVRAAQRVRVDARAAEAYRVSLAGWRAFDRKAFDQAEADLERAVAMRPTDMVARYRYGHVLRARGKTAAAIEALDAVARAGASTPPAFFADACLELAAIVEARGDASRALALNRLAARTFGASAATRAAADRNVARLLQSAG